ncbi:cation diffusion facilitator family transporter [Nesterenkonia muleiensis]|uniref:cation diffusion facilitator family transporter n=1 Tax=Nesterenkonia muleiensis TaxID=2282648 RepID=UPI000E738D92|nr:cation transporter [Nesterenkonia muleiensis]
MRTEQQALKISLVAILIFAVLGISFGLVSGSSAIIFDGVFSLVDAVMSVVSIVVSSLIVRSTSNGISRRLQRRFTMGFWHFEPIILAVNALLMMSVGAYALVQSVLALLSGGREIEFGPAIIYAVIILVLTLTVTAWEYRANKRIRSALVDMDIKGWIMAAGVTSALLIAFVIGFFLDGTPLEWLRPYVDPAVLAVVALALIPVPLSILRKAVAELALVTPEPLLREAEEVAARVGESQGFTDFRIYAAQLGRAKQIEIIFQVPASMPPKPLQQWDAIRAGIQRELGQDDPNHWITVIYTTKELPEGDIAVRTT